MAKPQGNCKTGKSPDLIRRSGKIQGNADVIRQTRWNMRRAKRSNRDISTR